MSKNRKESHPISLYDKDNMVIQWDEASEELKAAYWISMGVIRIFKKNRGPDMGHGKSDRRKDRGGPKTY